MKLDKAIERLQFLISKPNKVIFHEDVEALKLGIEAMKGIKKIRKTFRPYVEALLPGETEE